jgi:hypothetical protein
MKCSTCGKTIRKVSIVRGVNSITYTINRVGNLEDFVYEAEGEDMVVELTCANGHDIKVDIDSDEKLKTETAEFLEEHYNRGLDYG